MGTAVCQGGIVGTAVCQGGIVGTAVYQRGGDSGDSSVSGGGR